MYLLTSEIFMNLEVEVELFKPLPGAILLDLLSGWSK